MADATGGVGTPSGWQPDPSWPPAPPGWQFWVTDDAGTAVEASEPKKGFLTTRHEAKARERYEHDLAEWSEEDEQLQSFLQAATTFDGFDPSTASGFMLKPGEKPFLLISNAALIEPRATPGHWKGEFHFRLELAIAVWRGDRTPLVTALESQRSEHALSRPALPA